jgi:hypothetical protein
MYNHFDSSQYVSNHQLAMWLCASFIGAVKTGILLNSPKILMNSKAIAFLNPY